MLVDMITCPKFCPPLFINLGSQSWDILFPNETPWTWTGTKTLYTCQEYSGKCINTNVGCTKTNSLLFRVVSHICKETREHTADDLVSKANEDAMLVCLHKVRGTDDQQPECLNEFTFAMCNSCIRWDNPKCLLVPITK